MEAVARFYLKVSWPISVLLVHKHLRQMIIFSLRGEGNTHLFLNFEDVLNNDVSESEATLVFGMFDSRCYIVSRTFCKSPLSTWHTLLQ